MLSYTDTSTPNYDLDIQYIPGNPIKMEVSVTWLGVEG